MAASGPRFLPCSSRLGPERGPRLCVCRVQGSREGQRPGWKKGPSFKEVSGKCIFILAAV